MPTADDAGAPEGYPGELLVYKNFTPLLRVLIIFSLVFIWELLTPRTRCLLSRKFFILFLKLSTPAFFTSILMFYQAVPVASQYFTLRCFNYV